MTGAAGWHKQSRRKWELDRIYTMTTFEVPDIKWVERFVVGISHPDHWLSQGEISKQLEVVNRALRYGRIISIEQNITTLSHGKKDIITQYTVYHVGFKQRPPGK